MSAFNPTTFQELPPEEKKKRATICGVCCCIIVIIALGVGLGLGLSKKETLCALACANIQTDSKPQAAFEIQSGITELTFKLQGGFTVVDATGPDAIIVTDFAKKGSETALNNVPVLVDSKISSLYNAGSVSDQATNCLACRRSDVAVSLATQPDAAVTVDVSAGQEINVNANAAVRTITVNTNGAVNQAATSSVSAASVSITSTNAAIGADVALAGSINAIDVTIVSKNTVTSNALNRIILTGPIDAKDLIVTGQSIELNNNVTANAAGALTTATFNVASGGHLELNTAKTVIDTTTITLGSLSHLDLTLDCSTQSPVITFNYPSQKCGPVKDKATPTPNVVAPEATVPIWFTCAKWQDNALVAAGPDAKYKPYAAHKAAFDAAIAAAPTDLATKLVFSPCAAGNTATSVIINTDKSAAAKTYLTWNAIDINA